MYHDLFYEYFVRAPKLTLAMLYLTECQMSNDTLFRNFNETPYHISMYLEVCQFLKKHPLGERW